MKRQQSFILKTNNQPDFSVLNGADFSAETVALEDKFLTRIRLDKTQYLSQMQELFPYAQFQPKPWKDLAKDAYFKNDGKFIEGENYWKSGTLPLTKSILRINSSNAKTKSEVLLKIKEQVCKEDSPWNWNKPKHREALIREYLPEKHMLEHQSRIINEMDGIHSLWKQSNPSLHVDRFCIIINGEAGTGKTTLAKRIVEKMADHDLVSARDSWIVHPTPRSTDKLASLKGKEVVIYDDYSPRNHIWYIFNRFTGKEVGEFGIKGGYETNADVKGAIYPTTNPIETWLSDHTPNMLRFGQLLRRADCNLYIFEDVLSEEEDRH